MTVLICFKSDVFWAQIETFGMLFTRPCDFVFRILVEHVSEPHLHNSNKGHSHGTTQKNSPRGRR